MTYTICLNMIVKNESAVIIKTLNNLTSKIKFDYLEKGLIPGEVFSLETNENKVYTIFKVYLT